MDGHQSANNEDTRRVCIISFLSSRQVLRRVFLTVTACIFGAKWRRSSITREAKMPRITVNHLHRPLQVLPQTFVRSTSRPTQLHLQHQVLHIQHSPRSCQESIQHWDPAPTHHILAYRHLLARPTSLSRAHPTVMSNGLGRRRRIANNENRTLRLPYWQDKLFSRSWAARSGMRSAAILPRHILHRHLRLRR